MVVWLQPVMFSFWRAPLWRQRAEAWLSWQSESCGSLAMPEVDQKQYDARITEELSLLRTARHEFDRCPSADNDVLQQMHQRELDNLLDRRSRLSPATIPDESPAPRSTVSS